MKGIAMSTKKPSKVPATPQAAWRAVNQAVEAKIDPIGMMTPLMHAQLAWLSHPQEMSETLTEFSTQAVGTAGHSWHRALGMPSKDVVSPNPDDTRFADPVWNESASWDIVKEWYLMLTHQVQDMLYDTPGLVESRPAPRRVLVAQMAQRDGADQFPADQSVGHAKGDGNARRKPAQGIQQFRHRLPGGRRANGASDGFHGRQGLGDHAGQGRFPQSLLEVIHYTPTREKGAPAHRDRHAVDQQVLHARSQCQEEHGQVLVDQGFDVYITSWKNPTPTCATSPSTTT
jgi:polyhydroxyalkanoate synthase